MTAYLLAKISETFDGDEVEARSFIESNDVYEIVNRFLCHEGIIGYTTMVINLVSEAKLVVEMRKAPHVK